MNSFILIAVLLLLTALAYQLGRRRVLQTAGGDHRALHSLPGYYGAYVAIFCGLPALLIVGLWLVFEPQIVETILVNGLPAAAQALPAGELNLLVNDIRNIATGNISSRTPGPAVLAAADRYNDLRNVGFAAMAVVGLVVAIGGLAIGRRRIQPTMRARPVVEGVVHWTLLIASIIAVLTTIGIVLSLLFESIRFFEAVSPFEFLFGLDWSPQTALREDQVGGSGAFGAVPIFAGTLLITVIAMAVAVPIGLLSAIYMAEYASPALRSVIKPLLEILAGIPTVVYGFFAALTIGPALRGFGEQIGIGIASESALAAGLVMGVMIIPFVGAPGGFARRAARHRRRRFAGCQPRHRRDHDRRHGRRPRRQPDRQPVRGGDHGHRTDRHVAGRRSGI
jgi:phosphate transport system permease protein